MSEEHRTPVQLWSGPRGEYPDESILRNIVKESSSYSDVLRKLGKKLHGSNHTHLKNKLIELEIPTEHFGSNFGIYSAKNTPKSHEEILILNSEGSKRTPRAQLLRSLLYIGRDYVCSICGIGSEWNGSALTLEIDHIDGNFLNNLEDNLRFLCPNCHSQQETSFKSKSINPNNFCICGGTKYKTSSKCRNCSSPTRKTKIEWPSDDELISMLKVSSFTQVGKILGVSDNSIRKHLVKNLGSVAQMGERLAEN